MDYLQAWDKFQDLSYDQLPDDVVKVANQCILDWFGCAIAGSAEPLAAIRAMFLAIGLVPAR